MKHEEEKERKVKIGIRREKIVKNTDEDRMRKRVRTNRRKRER